MHAALVILENAKPPLMTDEELREMLAAGGSSKDKDKPAKDYVTDREFFAILNKGNT
jgi:hypothetical protein